MSVTPEFQLRTMFALDTHGRIRSSTEPNARPGPYFGLIRSASSCAWAVRADVPEEVAVELDRLASEERPIDDPQAAPLHADAYLDLVGGQIKSGPAFTFPEDLHKPCDVALVDKLELLERHFRGWLAAEILWCSPIVAVMDGGYLVSVCFCATRNSAPAVEAGVETAPAYRRRGFAARVTAAWACAVKASGRIPLYSTDWSNAGSLAVTRKLGLVQYGTDWSLIENSRT